ncbi:putative glucose and ribitol dehydrogenase protein [Phaeoacremonium minimum UCRPA7]|uniref:Putative glucose and ribitol dehydrogenase protein n=1 Tax=Phaeoacremonium minimum (strain UCR-PA7) TaxID=1286976 RepID=R8BN90_PHAM7|nr:putative glucose and ribitol dehydrogenase protein [Phaeoacremonium minimum UCRPA7]EOO00809.1 putative glucose and ribitol dehydrogenase protein [Phaeoacremonium minimum UCRPA7]
MSRNEKGSFDPVKEPQAQNLPGYAAVDIIRVNHTAVLTEARLEKDMNPSSETTALEGKTRHHEYLAAGKLKGNKAFITGGDSGIGRSVAVLFAREGSDVTIVYLPEEQDDAEETKKMVEKEGQECLLIPGDLMDNETCRKAIEKHVEKFGKVHVLVNNASKQIMCQDITEIDLDEVESTFRSNILQMFAVTKYAVPHMEKGGSIINTTSTVAFRGTKSMVDYAATKGAITSFTRSLAKQLIEKGIRVNAVAPGPVHTPLQPASRPAEQMEGFGETYQLGRPDDDAF